MAKYYPHPFKLCTNVDIKLHDVLTSQGRKIHFRRTLSGVTLQQWKEILRVIRNLKLTHNTEMGK